jgi:prepilin-type N-terminal cleavage/methylation domain-containing protein
MMKNLYQGRADRRKGFTLIELLIVVAIIAILAAIAVPNFLEAQVRAKVSRVKADQRTFATAVEAYTVDHNKPPPGPNTLKNANCVSNPITDPPPPPYSHVNIYANIVAQSALTTPVAYMATILHDPFSTRDWNDVVARKEFHYQDYLHPNLGNTYKRIFKAGFTWSILSRGPAKHAVGPQAVIRGDGDKGNEVYDPTNGTMSWGCIVRTNKGVFAYQGPIPE